MRCIVIVDHANIVGGCYVQGSWLRNAFRWRESIGPWEERPGHFGDCWNYWTDDGLGYFEFLQVPDSLFQTRFSLHGHLIIT
jgi:alpha-N-arabinofuranosidase